MPSFGEKLRQERESRNTALEEIASTTKIQIRYLEALETNDFDTLPGLAFGKFYIRSYAEVVGFDPDPLIADYDREQQGRIQSERDKALAGKPARKRPGKRISFRPPASPEPPPDVSTEPVPPGQIEVEVPEPPAEDEPAPIIETPPSAAEALKEETAAVVSDLAAALHTPGPDARPTRLYIGLAIVGVAVVALALYLVFTPSSPAPPTTSVAAPAPAPAEVDAEVDAAVANEALPQKPETPVEAVIAAEPQASGARSVEATSNESGSRAEEAPAEPEAAPPPPSEARATPGLSVSEFGIGREVVRRQLQGRSDRFEEGTAAAFATRVVGGKAGESIDHVWIHEGRSVQTIRLRLGGSHWRTHSRKTLWGVGSWAVEARDSDGRVLARATFGCVPPTR